MDLVIRQTGRDEQKERRLDAHRARLLVVEGGFHPELDARALAETLAIAENQIEQERDGELPTAPIHDNASSVCVENALIFAAVAEADTVLDRGLHDLTDEHLH